MWEIASTGGLPLSSTRIATCGASRHVPPPFHAHVREAPLRDSQGPILQRIHNIASPLSVSILRVLNTHPSPYPPNLATPLARAHTRIPWCTETLAAFNGDEAGELVPAPPPAAAAAAPARRRRNTTGLKGVRMRKWGRWVSEIRIPKSRSRIWLGSYDAPEKAARAYDAALYCLRGPRANFNYVADRRPEFPDGMPARLTRSEIKALAATFASLGAAAAVAAIAAEVPPNINACINNVPQEAVGAPSLTPSPSSSTTTVTPDQASAAVAADHDQAAASNTVGVSDNNHQVNSFVGADFTCHETQDTFLHENFLLEDQIMSGNNSIWDVL